MYGHNTRLKSHLRIQLVSKEQYAKELACIGSVRNDENAGKTCKDGKFEIEKCVNKTQE